MGRQGLSDISNQFHYRLTEDNRILWGGYDVIYYWRGKMNSELESRRDLGEAEQALLRYLPAAGGPQVHACMGRRDRHL